MRPNHKLEDIAALFDVPTSTIVQWLSDVGHTMRWIGGRYYIPESSVDALRERFGDNLAKAEPPSAA